MFKKNRTVIIVLVVLVAVAVALFILRGSEDRWICEDGEWVKHGVPSAEKPTTDCGEANVNTTTDADTGRVLEQKVYLTSPTEGGEISSPLLITGQAQGTWFFEATMPVKLLDAEGNVLAQSYVTADGDWMTEDFIEFAGTLEFTAEPGIEATLVIAKDNPSDFPEYDDQVEYAVIIAL